MSVSFREQQRRKAIFNRSVLFLDPGQGLYRNKPREFVLSDPRLNLWEETRSAALEYFRNNEIIWWPGATHPSGHLLSSQVACINHLFFARVRGDIATNILHAISSEVCAALPLIDGYVEFEYIGSRQLLRERGFTRGANCTSLDAVMLGRTNSGKKILFLIEWKYTEDYPPNSLWLQKRSDIYDSLIVAAEGPFLSSVEPKSLYFEPFYQMMRQTLLGHLFLKNRELDCDDYVHVHVVPDGNIELKTRITSPFLFGDCIHTAWTALLRAPHRYVAIDPEALLKRTSTLPDTRCWLDYLKRRYWA